MKRNILILVAVLSLLALAHQPVAGAVNLDLGLKAGLSPFSSFDDPYVMANHHKNKPFVYGAFLAFNLSKKFAIQLEFYLRTLTAVQSSLTAGNLYEMVISYPYHFFPILAKYRFKNTGKVRPVIFAGIGFAGPGSEKRRNYINGVLQDIWVIARDYGYSAGGVVGGGVELTLSKLLLVLDVRLDSYSSQFTDTPFKYGALVIMAGIGI